MKYILNSNVVLVTVLDESMLVTLLESANGVKNMRSINETGAYFWRLMEDNLSVEEIINRSMQDYGISEERAKPAFMQFLRSLSDAGYLTIENE